MMTARQVHRSLLSLTAMGFAFLLMREFTPASILFAASGVMSAINTHNQEPKA